MLPPMTIWPGAFRLQTSAPVSPAERRRLLLVETQNGGHRAGVLLPGQFHEPAALLDQAEAVLKREGVRSDGGGVLAEAVAGHMERCQGREKAPLLGGGQTSEADDHDSRLGVLGLPEEIVRPLKAYLREGASQYGVGILEEAAGSRRRLQNVLPHAHLLRALAGEDPSRAGSSLTRIGLPAATRQGGRPRSLSPPVPCSCHRRDRDGEAGAGYDTGGTP